MATTCIVTIYERSNGNSVATQEEATTREKLTNACAKVFNVFELAEAIFLRLKMRDLLCGVQGTCQQWNAVVNKSGPLQELLYYKPTSDRKLFWKLVGSQQSKKHWKDANEEGIDPDHWYDPREEDLPRRVIQHPYLFFVCDEQWRSRDFVHRPEASWRRQLLTQPPIAEVMACHTEHGDDYVKLKSPNTGVTMGDVDRIGKDFDFFWGWSRWKYLPGHEHMKRLKNECRRFSK